MPDPGLPIADHDPEGITGASDAPGPFTGPNDVIIAGHASARKRTRNLAERIVADLDRLLEAVTAERRITDLEEQLRAERAKLNNRDTPAEAGDG